ncbi:Signal recognition particle, SRP9/SRP14 subunit [Ostreococcus tauri]|uniref:Signal recognition particle, SRP9/SRP14 subunit n=1 Tax=Ostreococcus tauri TaxID=70448 RepID=A0A090MDF8_OSTTA|nr:Signal recognition particle, SRP9/SRP14 subunit [Ostreococcus tauri]CEG00951.1 Signal recognition particle, SRP9/SRP14 subunit [Ostreococcus tauri]|eukprot:XP_022840695.1 Signal recognition particle, SRP9/SRP14 subunit [Ostreococcus tauri]
MKQHVDDFSRFYNGVSSLTGLNAGVVRVSFKYKHREGSARFKVTSVEKNVVRCTNKMAEARALVELGSSLLLVIAR